MVRQWVMAVRQGCRQDGLFPDVRYYGSGKLGAQFHISSPNLQRAIPVHMCITSLRLVHYHARLA